MQGLQKEWGGRDVVWLAINSTNASHSEFKTPRADERLDEGPGRGADGDAARFDERHRTRLRREDDAAHVRHRSGRQGHLRRGDRRQAVDESGRREDRQQLRPRGADRGDVGQAGHRGAAPRRTAAASSIDALRTTAAALAAVLVVAGVRAGSRRGRCRATSKANTCASRRRSPARCSSSRSSAAIRSRRRRRCSRSRRENESGGAPRSRGAPARRPRRGSPICGPASGRPRSRRPPSSCSRRARCASSSAANVARQQKLFASGFVSGAALDDARAQFKRDDAHVEGARSRRGDGEDAGAHRRDPRRGSRRAGGARGAGAERMAACAARGRGARVPGSCTTPTSSSATGCPPAAPVASLLPPGNVKVRFYVPEPLLGRLKLGQTVNVALRRLRRAVRGDDRVHRRSRGVHAAGALLQGEPREARLSRRSEAGAGRCRQAASGPAGRRDVAGVVSAAAPMAGEIVIDVRGLNKSFGRHHVVKDLALSVRRGEIFGFLGPNGSGKTTSIRMLCGLLTPDSGEGTCLGFDIRRESKAIKRHVGYMTQRFSLWEDLTIRENLRFVARMYAMDDVAKRASRPRSRDSASPIAPTSSRASSPAAGSSAWRWPRACCTSRSSCCWTSRPPASIPRRAAISGTSCTSSPRAASRCWSAPTTWTRPSAATSSATSSAGGCWRRARRDEVIASQSLVAWSVDGPGLAALATRLRALPAVEQVAAFGAALHVTGTDAARARRRARAVQDRAGPHVAADRAGPRGRVHPPDAKPRGRSRPRTPRVPAP